MAGSVSLGDVLAWLDRREHFLDSRLSWEGRDPAKLNGDRYELKIVRLALAVVEQAWEAERNQVA